MKATRSCRACLARQIPTRSQFFPLNPAQIPLQRRGFTSPSQIALARSSKSKDISRSSLADLSAVRSNTRSNSPGTKSKEDGMGYMEDDMDISLGEEEMLDRSGKGKLGRMASNKNVMGEPEKYGSDVEVNSQGESSTSNARAEEEEEGLEWYDADELESRLKGYRSPQTPFYNRIQEFKASSKSSPPPPSRSASTNAPIEYDDDYHHQTERQKPFDYDFTLEEPDLGPRVSFGMRKPVKERPEYPTVIKLRPDLDPEVDIEELEERRREGQIRRQAAAKRAAKGDFQDHIRVRVRGGRGGSGAASFNTQMNGKLGAPAGGNGGLGGAVYIQAVSGLTSLHTLPRRYMADQGGNGGKESRNGSAGNDLIITVPAGTVVREIIREGDEEAQWARMEQMEIEMEDRKWDRWERYFQVSASNPFNESYYAAAERLLRREKKWPMRTPTFEEKPPIILDLDKPTSEPILLAPGGTGGMGNTFFVGVVGHRQPRFSSRGVIPYTSTFELELKLLADVGLVGFPNAGKSTILRALTGRRAEVAGYQFTTLNPQIGVVRVWDDGSWNTGSGSNVGESGVVEESWKEKQRDNERRQQGSYTPLPRANRVRDLRAIDNINISSGEGTPIVREKIEAYRFTISDNPGLLPSAAENVGLGHSFLRSIERSLALAYILDMTRPNLVDDYKGLKTELEAYQDGLSAKGAVIVLNKGDEVDEGEGREKLRSIREAVREMEDGNKVEVVVISGKYGLGLDKLVKVLGTRVEAERERIEEEEREKEKEKERVTKNGLSWA